jgi:hypothetical protein
LFVCCYFAGAALCSRRDRHGLPKKLAPVLSRGQV